MKIAMQGRKMFGTLLAASLVVASASVNAVQVKTGKWEVTTKMVSPFGQPQEDTRTECVTDEEFDIAKELAQDDVCEIIDRKTTKKEDTFKVKCDGGPGQPQMNGSGRFRSEGKKAEGEMQMTMNFNGQEMEMTHSWKGRHVGPCD